MKLLTLESFFGITGHCTSPVASPGAKPRLVLILLPCISLNQSDSSESGGRDVLCDCGGVCCSVESKGAMSFIQSESQHQYLGLMRQSLSDVNDTLFL